MAKQHISKSCLIISYGPVPTPDHQTVEGGGMRAWGLAKGLQANNIDVTIGINNSFPQELSEFEGIRLINWGLDTEFIKEINSYDSVLISYCMGDPSVFVADNINDSVQLILDAYVPIYIEVSARNSKDIETEYVNYMADIGRFNRVLKRGDYFLYANNAQELMYNGVLSALGVVNPSSYREKRLICAPFGIHRDLALSDINPYASLGISSKDFIVLWFGGIYPWFRIEEYLDAIKRLSANKKIRFVFVGGKNPFNPNPDFSRQYDMAVKFAAEHRLTNKSVFFVDWVDFNERINWFKHADIIVSINQAGEENKYSWRTRVMDYVWGEVATISNGGDPLSEELIQTGGAIRLSELTAEALVTAIQSAEKNTKELVRMRRHVAELKDKYYWDVVTKETAETIMSGKLPYLNEQPLRKQIAGTASGVIMEGATIVPGRISRLAGAPGKVLRKVRKKGVRRSARIAVSILKTQVKQARRMPREKQYVFISHPINNTGAPIVLLQMIKEYAQRYGANHVRVIAPGIEKEQKEYLRKLGVSVEQAVFGISFRFIRLQLRLQKDDFVLMNTVAIYDNYRDFILLWLRTGRLKHAYWFIHEDIAQLPFIHKEFLDKKNLAQTARMMTAGSLTVFVSSKRTAQEYDTLLGVQATTPINLQVEVSEAYTKPRTITDFNEIHFLLSGSAGDGRKGQVLALSALYMFMKDYYEKKPQDYRTFKLHLVSVSKTEYISQQIRWISESLMPKHVVIYDSLPKAEAMAIAASCNTVICCSLNETFGLYIAEGMLMGHVVLRNNSAGVDEQLIEGRNGFAIDHTDIAQFASTLERVLNKDKLTNEQLLAMSQSSQQLIQNFTGKTYIDQIEAIATGDS